jgi:hypothetical protein
VLVLAGCGSSSPKANYEHHLQKDGAVLHHCCVTLTGAAHVHKVQRRVHAATLDLASATPPADARADAKAILAGFRFADTMLARLAGDLDRHDRGAEYRDEYIFKRSPILLRLVAAVHRLQQRGYDVGVIANR